MRSRCCAPQSQKGGSLGKLMVKGDIARGDFRVVCEVMRDPASPYRGGSLGVLIDGVFGLQGLPEEIPAEYAMPKAHAHPGGTAARARAAVRAQSQTAGVAKKKSEHKTSLRGRALCEF